MSERDLIAHVRSFARLKEDWDSYGALPPSQACCDLAISLLGCVGKDVQRVAPLPGGIIFYTGAFTVEVYDE